MPSQGSRDGDTVVQMPAELVERLVTALDLLARGQRAETQIEFQSLLATETNLAIERWQTAALSAIADRLGSLPSQTHTQRTGRQLTLAQRQLVLRYDALQTVLGRVGAAAIFVGVTIGEVVTIEQGNLPAEPLTLVAIGPKGEIGFGDLALDPETGKRRATIPGLNDQQTIIRFELRDQTGAPMRFGFPDRRLGTTGRR